jgi:hypothetical protein
MIDGHFIVQFKEFGSVKFEADDCINGDDEYIFKVNKKDDC